MHFRHALSRKWWVHYSQLLALAQQVLWQASIGRQTTEGTEGMECSVKKLLVQLGPKVGGGLLRGSSDRRGRPDKESATDDANLPLLLGIGTTACSPLSSSTE